MILDDEHNVFLGTCNHQTDHGWWSNRLGGTAKSEDKLWRNMDNMSYCPYFSIICPRICPYFSIIVLHSWFMIICNHFERTHMDKWWRIVILREKIIMFHKQNGHLTSNKIAGGMDYNQQSQDRIGYVITLHPTNNVPHLDPFGVPKSWGIPSRRHGYDLDSSRRIGGLDHWEWVALPSPPSSVLKWKSIYPLVN